MTEPRHVTETPGRWSRFWTAFRGWLPGRGTRRRIRPAPAERRRTPPRLGMESLEQRTTISEALLGLLWPTLWSAPSNQLAAAAPSRATAPSPAPDSAVPPAATFATWTATQPDLPERSVDRGSSVCVGVAAGPVTTWLGDSWSATQIGTDVPPPLVRWAAARPFSAMPADMGHAAAFTPVSEPPGRLFLADATLPAETPADPAAALLATVAGQVVVTPQDRGPHTQGSPFSVSYQSGQYDAAGNYMSATEITFLTGHQGRLFAGTSAWMNFPGADPVVGAQILRLDAPEGEWQVDHHFDEILKSGLVRYLRITALQSVTFTTDGAGHPLPLPVNMLVAGVWDRTGVISVFSRDDTTGAWTEMVLGQSAEPGQVRSFGFHRDAITGVQRLFAGASPLGVVSGVYDPIAPGRIRWDEQPEIALENRVMSFTVANGSLYMASKPRLYMRFDGPTPVWGSLLEYPDPPNLGEGLRALTAIPNTSGTGQDIVASFESGGGRMVRIFPTLGHFYVSELDVREFLRNRWGGLSVDVVTAGYNDLPAVVDRQTDQTVHLIGIMAFPPLTMPRTSSWYLLRFPNGSYDVREIEALEHPFVPEPILMGNRTITVSPFKVDKGRYAYFGGYDAVFLPARHTAWIYRAPVDSVL